ncbi:uncharacterized protein FA14DRAFT_162370 [Meira miltonrushii]|uniref:VPS9 domain-containing protein n=1 Tax=Meira miltonrushii TaxID=1280837 RepID=A0A316V520_9BASI|nr:uncharacterized protein FA14DRAFT_162370 [Meira miltonrushii]PWN32118.1 hypothetical protein FA14DRAFT_162370 [Meira miltonrushii]
MASALQKLFKKRLARQQQNDQSKSGDRSSKNKSSENRQTINGPLSGRLPPSFTVSDFHSPSSSSLHRFSASTSSSVHTTVSQPLHRPQIYSNDRGYSFDALDTENRVIERDRLRSSSMGASVMLRDRSTGSRSWRDSIISDGHGAATVDQFGTLIPDEAGSTLSSSHQGHKTEEEEEEDLEHNAIYAALLDRMGQTSKWASAKVLLIPSKAVLRTSNLSEEDLRSDAYISLHALTASSLFKDQFESLKFPVSQLDVSEDPWSRISLTTTFQLELHSVHIILTRTASTESKNSKHLKRSLKVISETNVYHTVQLQQNIQDSFPHKNRVRLRVLIVDGMVVPTSLVMRKSVRPPVSVASSARTTTFKMDEDRGSSVTFPTKDSKANTVIEDGKKNDSSLIPLSRQFLSDYAFLLDPPPSTGPLRGPLKCALDALERASAEFANAYVYVPGFDSYNVSRIRRGILARSWNAFEHARKANGDGERGREGDLDLTTWLGNDGRARLLLLLENVVMGYCHSKVYGSICSIRHGADEAFDSILATYHDYGISLSDLGITRKGIKLEPYDLNLAEAILGCLGDADEDMEYIMMDKNVAKIKQMAETGRLPSKSDLFDNGNFHSTQRTRCRIRTPLDALEVMHATLVEINQATIQSSRRQNEGRDTSTLGADDLLPILAYVLIRVAPRKLTSLLYYVRLFGISDVTLSKQNWTLTTFEAVVRYLADDPLDLSNGSDSLHLQRVQQAPPIRSTRSSLRSPTTSITSGSNIGRMERTSSQQASAHERSRRSSLPSSAMMSVQSSRQSTESNARQMKDYLSGKTFSSASSVVSHDGGMMSGDEGDTTVQAFKMPGQPASAQSEQSGQRPRLPTISIRQNEGGLDAMSEMAKSYSVDGNSIHRRTLSASSDLVIRPQIVMRASHRARESKSIIMDRPLSPQDGSTSSRGASPDPLPQGLQMDHRRRSIDSWSSLSFLHGNMSRPDMSRNPSAVTTTEEERNAGQRPNKGEDMIIAGLPDPAGASARSIGPTERNRSTSWLPTWTSDWGLSSRRPSLDPSNQSHVEPQDHSKVSQMSDPTSIASQDQSHNHQVDVSDNSIVIRRSESNQSVPALGFPSLDSMPSLEPHEGHATSLENDDATMGSSPRDRNSIMSSPSSVFSGASTSIHPHHDQATIRGSRGSWYMNDLLSSSSLGKASGVSSVHLTSPSSKHERRRGKSSSRLLSISTPTDPLPPALTTSDAAQALPNLFSSQVRISTPDDIQRRSTKSQINKRPRPTSITSTEAIPSVTLSPPLLDSRSKSSDSEDVSTLQGFSRKSSTSHDPLPNFGTSRGISSVPAYTSPSMQFIKLDIPSPVDERTDPIITTTMPNLS